MKRNDWYRDETWFTWHLVWKLAAGVAASNNAQLDIYVYMMLENCDTIYQQQAGRQAGAHITS